MDFPVLEDPTIAINDSDAPEEPDSVVPEHRFRHGSDCFRRSKTSLASRKRLIPSFQNHSDAAPEAFSRREREGLRAGSTRFRG